MSADDVVFMGPPPAPAGSCGRHWAVKRQATLVALTSNAGEWARVATGMKQQSALKRARSMEGRGQCPWPEVERGDIEAVARRNEAGTFDVFARYIGGDAA